MDSCNTEIFSDDPRARVNPETVTVFGDPGNNDPSPSVELLREQYDIPGGDDLKHFGKLKLIGLGGMGMVFQAKDQTLQRKVALKVLRADFRNRNASVKKFIREARMTARIDHPNIVPIHRIGVSEQVGVYFTMKRVHGEDLREIFERLAAGNEKAIQNYTLRRLLNIFISGCNGVIAAHARGVLHCDLKPGNIMVGRFGEVLVLDWGVARDRIPAGPYRPGEEYFSPEDRPIEGTPAFMAPELLCGEINYPDEQTDVYGMGAILYTIMTRGRLPFDAALSAEEVVQKAIRGDIIPVKHNLPSKTLYHHELAAICEKAMARDRMERYHNVEELRDDIENYLNGYPVSASQPTIWDRFVKLIRRRPLIPAVLLTIALALAGHYAFEKLQEYIDNRTLQGIIATSSREANANRRLVLRRINVLKNSKLSPEVAATLQQNIQSAAANAMVEYNVVFDAASRLTPQNQEQFLRSGGAEMFFRALRMNWQLKNRAIIRTFFTRCRSQWHELFTTARRINPELDELVTRINEQMKIKK